jgi:cytochrome c-type biogenesis protein CcmH/NrfG
MSLEEQGRYREALAAWEQVPLDGLSSARRAQVEAVIQELRESLNQ